MATFETDNVSMLHDGVGRPAPRQGRLRVAIIAHGMRVAGGLSVGTNLLESFGRVAPENQNLVVLPAGVGYESICNSLENREILWYRPGGWLRRFRFDSSTLPAAVEAFKPDVVFAMGGKGLLKPSCPQVAFPQDPHLIYPSRFFARESRSYRLVKRYLKWHLSRQLRVTDAVLCQTPVVERRTIDTFGYRGRTLVCGSAVSPHLLARSADAPSPERMTSVRAELKLVYVTKYYAHKNIEALVAMFDRFRKELEGVVLFLTIAPDQHPLAPSVLRDIDRMGLKEAIVNLGPIPHKEIAAVYQAADAFIMPSTLETFGLPYLEAMNYGLPILTSDLDFAHAVCGDAAIYFDPWDVRSIANAVIRMRQDAGLRQRLADLGRTRLQVGFRTWDEIARDINTLFHELVESHNISQ